MTGKPAVYRTFVLTREYKQKVGRQGATAPFSAAIEPLAVRWDAMPGISDLRHMLATMSPRLAHERYVFCSLPAATAQPLLSFARAMVVEREGVTLVLPKARADAEEIAYDAVFRMITLTVHSSLEGVGLVAAVAAELAAHGIAVNVLAGTYHDHLFVPEARAADARRALVELQGAWRARSAPGTPD